MKKKDQREEKPTFVWFSSLMKNAAIFIFFSLLLTELSSSVEIHEFSVPPLIEYGVQEEIILDCNFDFDSETETGQVDVKWYFNSDPSPFLQWIPGGDRKPQLIDESFRPHLDLDFQISENVDEWRRFRAVRIINVTPNVTGVYKCKVSSFDDEKSSQKNILVYAKPEKVDFSHTLLNSTSDYETAVDINSSSLEQFENQSIEVQCSVGGVLPEPRISVSWTSGDGTDYKITSPLSIGPSRQDPNLFDAVLKFEVNLKSLRGSSPTDSPFYSSLESTTEGIAPDSEFPDKVEMICSITFDETPEFDLNITDVFKFPEIESEAEKIEENFYDEIPTNEIGKFAGGSTSAAERHSSGYGEGDSFQNQDGESRLTSSAFRISASAALVSSAAIVLPAFVSSVSAVFIQSISSQRSK